MTSFKRALTILSFGFFVALNALTPVWLQQPISEGGVYGFTVAENAACKCQTVALLYPAMLTRRQSPSSTG